jgi:hypothetical protein
VGAEKDITKIIVRLRRAIVIVKVVLQALDSLLVLALLDEVF